MTDHAERWTDVRTAIGTAMADKGWAQADLMRASGVSDYTIRKIVNGEPGNYRDSILAKVSKALWGDAHGITRILEGGEPSAGAGHEGEDSSDEVVVAILRSQRITDDQRDLLLTMYRGAVARTAGAKGSGSPIHGEHHGFG